MKRVRMGITTCDSVRTEELQVGMQHRNARKNTPHLPELRCSGHLQPRPGPGETDNSESRGTPMVPERRTGAQSRQAWNSQPRGGPECGRLGSTPTQYAGLENLIRAEETANGSQNRADVRALRRARSYNR